MVALPTLASDLGTYAAADALLQSLRSSDGDPGRRVRAAHAVAYARDSAYWSDGQFPEPGGSEGEDSVSVLAIGARRFLPPPN